MAAAVLLVLGAYVLGSVPLAYLIGLWVRGIDIRRVGSGNVGASNIWVHVGRWYIFPLGAFDLFVKGALPVWAARWLEMDPWMAVAAGLAAIIGHNWSLFLRFTGGRGIGTAIGVLYALAPMELMGFVLIGFFGWVLFRSSALWVGIGVAMLPLWSLALGEPGTITLFCVGLLAVAAVKRLTSNPGTGVQGLPLGRVLLHRLLFDRDISSRDQWVYRGRTGAPEEEAR